jgi:hypothetical protein
MAPSVFPVWHGIPGLSAKRTARNSPAICGTKMERTRQEVVLVPISGKASSNISKKKTLAGRLFVSLFVIGVERLPTRERG